MPRIDLLFSPSEPRPDPVPILPPGPDPGEAESPSSTSISSTGSMLRSDKSSLFPWSSDAGRSSSTRTDAAASTAPSASLSKSHSSPSFGAGPAASSSPAAAAFVSKNAWTRSEGVVLAAAAGAGASPIPVEACAHGVVQADVRNHVCVCALFHRRRAEERKLRCARHGPGKARAIHEQMDRCAVQPSPHPRDQGYLALLLVSSS